ncbi:MAG: hypothetical protein HC837_03485 [Chloroflexaceae bacterium]|nr:hypothetical protein [Chloroflexaceae bacterium]
MLQLILHEFRQSRCALSLDTLSQRLQIEPAVLEGMLSTLVRMGRICEVSSSPEHCSSCPISHHCPPAGSHQSGYMLTEAISEPAKRSA